VPHQEADPVVPVVADRAHGPRVVAQELITLAAVTQPVRPVRGQGLVAAAPGHAEPVAVQPERPRLGADDVGPLELSDPLRPGRGHRLPLPRKRRVRGQGAPLGAHHVTQGPVRQVSHEVVPPSPFVRTAAPTLSSGTQRWSVYPPPPWNTSVAPW